MSIRDWGWQQWTLIIGGVLLIGLLVILIFITSQPEIFAPQPTDPTEPGITGLPPTIEGSPQFPPSDIESIPLGQIQDFNNLGAPDIVASGGVTIIGEVTNYPVNFPAATSDGSGINYYDPETKRFYRIDENGVIERINNQIFAEVEDVAWAPNSQDAILEFPDGSNVLYNFETGDQVTLPAHWTEFDFAPDNENIAFKSLPRDPNENWLAVSSKDGSTSKRIEHLGNFDDTVTIDWSPNNQVVGTFSEPDGLSRSKLFYIGFNGENFQLSRLHGHNFEGSWAPDGRNLTYSVAHEDTNFNPSLWVVDGSGASMGQNRKSIGLQTWTHKCTYADNTTMYCGVPTELPRGAGLIPTVAEFVDDEIYKVDISTGATTRIAIPDSSIQVSSIHFLEEANRLIIQDAFTNELRSIDL